MARKKDNDCVDLEKGDVRVKIPFKIIMAIILLVIVLIAGVVVLYSDWSFGKFNHDANDVPKPPTHGRR